MRVASHQEARQVIHRDHLTVREVVHVRGGVRYNCTTKGKKRARRAITITVEGRHNYKPPKVTKTRKGKK